MPRACQARPKLPLKRWRQWKPDLPHRQDCFRPSIDFDVVGYACTSGASVIGAAAVAAQVRRGVKTREVTNPMSALAAACAALGISQTALLSPYVAHVSDALRAALAENGVETPVFGSFDEAEEARVARMDPASVVAPAVELAGQGDVQGGNP